MKYRSVTSAREGLESKSHLEILKSTAVVGSSAVANIIVGVVRNKAVAVMLGPEGVGLMSLFQSIADLAQSLASFGVQSSGVRQIAAAVGTNNSARIAWTATVLRRVSFGLGAIGALLLALLAAPLSILSFGGYQQTLAIALLGIAVFLRTVSGGQTALLQGTRRISHLARANVLGAVLGAAATLPLIYMFGLAGVVASIIASAVATLLASWLYSRKVRIEAPPMPMSYMGPETLSLLKLGFAFLASSLFSLGAAYAIRIILMKEVGVDATGLYQAAWTLGGLYIGVILQAMGADFYPRLTAVADNNAECNRLVNEQAKVCMLLAAPGVLATLTLAPLVMIVFYSAEFRAAVDLLRSICLGMMLRIVAWPMGFVILAKGDQKSYFWVEAAAMVVQVGLALVLVRYVGVNGAGIAFAALYIWHSLIVYAVVRRSSGFRWTPGNLQLIAIFVGASVLVFACLTWLPFWPGLAVGLLATFAAGLYSLRHLLVLCPEHLLPAWVRPWIAQSL